MTRTGAVTPPVVAVVIWATFCDASPVPYAIVKFGLVPVTVALPLRAGIVFKLA